jgi:two-component system response regulator VicR
LTLAKYTFFPQKFELHLNDQIKELSHRETQLLKILTEHRNIAVDRRDILKQVWGDDSFFNSRNLDVYIKKLRNFLKEDEKVKIVTLKGIGYHFVVE